MKVSWRYAIESTHAVAPRLILKRRSPSCDANTIKQLMQMELDRLQRQVEIKYTRQDAIDMRKVYKRCSVRLCIPQATAPLRVPLPLLSGIAFTNFSRSAVSGIFSSHGPSQLCFVSFFLGEACQPASYTGLHVCQSSGKRSLMLRRAVCGRWCGSRVFFWYFIQASPGRSWWRGTSPKGRRRCCRHRCSLRRG